MNELENNVYYKVDPCSWKFDLSDKKDNPVAYFLRESEAEKYGGLWPGTVEINSVENPKHLEFVVFEKDDSKISVSFKLKSHFEKYLEDKWK